jgi:hypothetical protein
VRRILPLALALVLVALAGPAAAEPPNPNHVVLQTLGRRLVAYNHFGDPNRGHVTASAQGELVDTNNNGLANAIRARGALLEDHGVERFRMYSIALQRQGPASTWITVVDDQADAVSTNQPAYLVNYTFAIPYCVSDRQVLTYRVVHRDAIRWTDGTVGFRTTVSNQFQARRVASDLDCHDPG